MTKPLLLLWTDGAEPYAQAIEAAGLGGRLRVEVVPRAATPDEALLAQAEALLSWGPPAGTLARMPRLRFVQALTAGVEHWLARPDLPAGLALSCARGTHRVQMPENILGALFHVAKPYAAIVGDNAAARWTRRVSTTLAGQTLGILGLGAIGAELARKAAALEMRVIGTKRTTADLPHVDRVFTPDQTDTVLAQSDFVVLLLPATPQTENFIDASRLSRMKPTAWLLNFGRGALIKDDDLVAATRAGTIAGAVLDVFRTEPLPATHPFWAEEKILVLPHIGGLHPGRDAMVAALLVENLRRFVDGAPLTQLVDRQAGYLMAYRPFDLTGKVALVTGGNSGIGLGMAQALAEAGADIAIWGTSAAKNATALAALSTTGVRVHAEVCDVGDEAAVEVAFAGTLAALGRVDACFANAGTYGRKTRFTELDSTEWHRVTRVNLDGAFYTLRTAARHMAARGGGGSLVGTASLAAIEGAARNAHYAATKGALVAVIRALAVELARDGIRANAILPGWIETAMTARSVADERFAAAVLPRIPARRWGTGADFGGLAVYLASDASAYHSGDCLVVDGGYSLF